VGRSAQTPPACIPRPRLHPPEHQGSDDAGMCIKPTSQAGHDAPEVVRPDRPYPTARSAGGRGERAPALLDKADHYLTDQGKRHSGEHGDRTNAAGEADSKDQRYPVPGHVRLLRSEPAIPPWIAVRASRHSTTSPHRTQRIPDARIGWPPPRMASSIPTPAAASPAIRLTRVDLISLRSTIQFQPRRATRCMHCWSSSRRPRLRA
jgi:hypothetical protein